MRTAIEFGLIRICALLVSVSYGIYWVAFAYNCAVLLYLPRSLWLLLTLIECPIKTYVKAMIVPALTTLSSIVLYAEIVSIFSPDKYQEAAIAVLLCVIAMAISALVQIRPLLNESALLALPFRSNQNAA